MWVIEILPEVSKWLLACDVKTQARIYEALELLQDKGPRLGRPIVDKVSHSSLHNLKELRPGSSGNSEIRILFIFDPSRHAVLLVAGDKSSSYKNWYVENIPVAENRYALYLKGLENE